RLKDLFFDTKKSEGVLLTFGTRLGEALTGQDLADFQSLLEIYLEAKELAEGNQSAAMFSEFVERAPKLLLHFERALIEARLSAGPNVLPGRFVFTLYDTYGFPLDLTQLIARERGLTIDTAGFDKFMEEQRERARAAQKREVISVTHIEG